MQLAKLRRAVPFAAVAIAAAAFASGSFAATVLKVEESTRLAAKPAEVWKLLGDFGKLEAWHPAVAKTSIAKGEDNRKGAVRAVETKDGARIVEQLLAYDPNRMSMRYRIVESPLPVADYRSTLTVGPDGEGSRVVWKSAFKAKGADDAKAREVISGIYKAGFDGLHQQLDGAAGR